MSNLATFTPLMRQSVGFDRFNDLFESLLNDKDDRFESYPPYNIEKLEDDLYRIEIAVSGFSEEEIDIVVQDDRLQVSAAKRNSEEEKGRTYLHRGIAARSFERSFRLADHIRVVDASLENGMLVISLMREVPEEKKPRMVPINGVNRTHTSKKTLMSKRKEK
ncbi:MAG: Hsp20 family protein [Alphaproteobacteria bacterium]